VAQWATRMDAASCAGRWVLTRTPGPDPARTPRLRTMNDIGLTAWFDTAPATAIALSGAAAQADDAGSEDRPAASPCHDTPGHQAGNLAPCPGGKKAVRGG